MMILALANNEMLWSESNVWQKDSIPHYSVFHCTTSTNPVLVFYFMLELARFSLEIVFNGDAIDRVYGS